MNEIQQTHDFEGQPIRMLGTVEEPLFVASDVCRVLGIKNSRDAVERLDSDEKGVASTDTLGGKQEATVLTEAGFYRLVNGARAKGERADLIRRFQRWVAHDVLVPLRRKGHVEDTKGMLHPTPVPALDDLAFGRAQIEFAERARDLLASIDMLDDRKKAVLADLASNATERIARCGRVAPSDLPALPAPKLPKTVAELCLERGLTDRDICLSQVGRLAKMKFVLKHGTDVKPLALTQLIKGRPTSVTVYAEEDWPLVHEAIGERLAIENGSLLDCPDDPIKPTKQ